MNKGTILYIGFFSLPDKDAAACRVMNNAKILKLLGYNVIFIDEQKEYPFKNIFYSRRKINEFTVYSLERPRNLKKYLNKMFNVNSIKPILDEINDLKMVIAYNYPAIALNQLTKTLRGKVKICSDCTEWYSGKEYNFPLNILSKIDSFLRMRIINKKLDGIICISSFLNDYYRKKNETVFLPPLIDLKDNIWYQKKIKFSSEKINLIYAGNPGRCKDLIKPVVHAIFNFKYKNSITLRIVGITKEQYLKQNPEDAKIINMDNILFLGKVSHSENIKMVGSSDFLIFIREKNRVSMAGFSTKFVEAITSNTTVITTNTSDIKKYIKQSAKGIVLENIEELQFVLMRVYEEWINYKKLKNRKSEEEYIKPCSIFDYKNYVSDMKSWIDKLLGEKNDK